MSRRDVVLVVEDDLHSRYVYTRALEAGGYEPIGVADGAHALDVVAFRRVDCVVLDLALPRMSGLQVARSLRARPEFGATPVVAMSAVQFPGERELAIEAGCDEFHAKPFAPSDLLDTVRRRLAPVPIS